MRHAMILALAMLASPALAQSTPTLVQQLQSWIDYDTEYLEYNPCTQCYTNWHLQRAIRNLAKAQAACNAGQCLPPILTESGQVAPLFAPYTPHGGGGGGTPEGGASRGTGGGDG